MAVAVSSFFIFHFTYLSSEQEGIGEWSGTSEGMIGKNFEKCTDTRGSHVTFGKLPICHMPDGTSYDISE